MNAKQTQRANVHPLRQDLDAQTNMVLTVLKEQGDYVAGDEMIIREFLRYNVNASNITVTVNDAGDLVFTFEVNQSDLKAVIQIGDAARDADFEVSVIKPRGQETVKYPHRLRVQVSVPKVRTPAAARFNFPPPPEYPEHEIMPADNATPSSTADNATQAQAAPTGEQAELLKAFERLSQQMDASLTATREQQKLADTRLELQRAENERTAGDLAFRLKMQQERNKMLSNTLVATGVGSTMLAGLAVFNIWASRKNRSSQA